MLNWGCAILLAIAALISSLTSVNGQLPTCPNGVAVYISPSTNAAVPCIVNIPGPCPTGTTCLTQTTNALALQSLCCLSTAAVTSCSVGQILISGQCFASAAPGQPCAVLGQCTGGAICTGSICNCAVGQTLIGGVCSTTIVTTCAAGQVLVNGVCLNQVGIGLPCTDPTQCLGGSTCLSLLCSCLAPTTNVNGICSTVTVTVAPTPAPVFIPTCTATQVLVNGVCLNNVGPGSTCQSTLQCQFTSTCISGVCVCPVGQQNLGGTCAIPSSVTFPIGTLTTVATGTGTATGTGVADCPVGSVLLYPTNQQPVVCGLLGVPTGSCPSSYPTCMYSARLAQTVCCSVGTSSNSVVGVVATNAPTVTTSATGCATGNILLYPTNNQPVVCGTQGSPGGSCPSTNPYCVASASLGYSVCCSTNVG